MKLYHQTGFRHTWNIECLEEDGAGDGLIFSPVNIEQEKLTDLAGDLKTRSFFDPQFYMPKEKKGKLPTYDYFPANLADKLETPDIAAIASQSVCSCVDFQVEQGFQYVVLPARYSSDIGSDYFDISLSTYVEPAIEHHTASGYDTPLLLTVIVRPIQLRDDRQRAALLNWITRQPRIAGVYMIFDNDFDSKQIKDSAYLARAMFIIAVLKRNGLEVHLGYTNTEGLLYSIAQPDSISMGSYENLRDFGVNRFQNLDNDIMRGPNARLYSAQLLQWIEYTYIEAILQLYEHSGELFEDTQYRARMLEPEYNWHFQRPQPYKHFFKVYSEQVSSLSDNPSSRTACIRDWAAAARDHYAGIENAGVVLDSNSDGSHLPHWLTAIPLYDRYLEEDDLDV